MSPCLGPGCTLSKLSVPSTPTPGLPQPLTLASHWPPRLSFQLGPEGLQALPRGPSAHPTPLHTSVHGPSLAVPPPNVPPGAVLALWAFGSLKFENRFIKAGGQNRLVKMPFTPLAGACQPRSLEGARTEPRGRAGRGGGPGSITVGCSDEPPPRSRLTRLELGRGVCGRNGRMVHRFAATKHTGGCRSGHR